MNDRVLEIERVFKAAPEAVFTAFTDPKKLAEWWGPEGMTAPDVSLDPQNGGKWQTTMVNAEGDAYTCSGVYRTVDPHTFLSFTWGWRQPDGSRGHETVVEIRFEPADGGTRMKFLQQTFQDAEARDSHEEGWVSTFNKLGRLVSEKAAA